MATAVAPWAAANSLAPRLAKKGVKSVKTAMMPYTNAGGREVARQRIQGLAGGETRARELAGLIGDSDIGLTPAQMTGDKNMLALEQEAARASPALRERLDIRQDASQEAAGAAIGDMGGDPGDAQSFIAQRQDEARERVQGFVREAQRKAEASIPRASRTEAENSQILFDELVAAETRALGEEKRLWGLVPKGVQVKTDQARSEVMRIMEATPQAYRDHIPSRQFRLLLEGDDSLGAATSVGELHALYSELRHVAREAMAKPVPDKHKAAMANQVAKAILEDLGATSGDTLVGRAINTARVYSRAMHETFDQGAVGDILKRSAHGGEKRDPILALDGSVGRPGNRGQAGQADILQAADTNAAQDATEDYLRSQFEGRVFPNDKFSDRGAWSFMRDRGGVLSAHPYLRESFENSIGQNKQAVHTTKRGEGLLASIAKSPGVQFVDDPSSVFRNKTPFDAALSVVRTAHKDATGKAVGGVKGAFLDHVIRGASKTIDGKAVVSGNAIQDFLSNPGNRKVLATAFKPDELDRLSSIAKELTLLERANTAQGSIGPLSAQPANRVIDYVARVIAARHGAQMGGGSGGSIQTAGMASERMKAILGKLQNDKATQILIDAVENPDLFTALLMDPGRIEQMPSVRNRLAPYFVGTAAAMEEQE